MPINFSELIETEILKLKREPGKFQYGISTYPENPSLIRKLLKTAKTTLKENGVSSRYLNQDNNNLSSIMSANCEEINLV
ncbi:MAG: hypothetical protein WCT46_05985, partial [Candidatus Gracilibacteria bacterium]